MRGYRINIKIRKHSDASHALYEVSSPSFTGVTATNCKLIPFAKIEWNFSEEKVIIKFFRDTA